MKYQLFQVRRSAMLQAAFRPYNPARPVNPAHYEQTYAGEFTGDAAPDWARLEAIYRTFNLNRPDDFRGYSVSVADVVVLDGERAFYCDSLGWEPIDPGFIKEAV